jgi:hypothetical protein
MISIIYHLVLDKIQKTTSTILGDLMESPELGDRKGI